MSAQPIPAHRLHTLRRPGGIPRCAGCETSSGLSVRFRARLPTLLLRPTLLRSAGELTQEEVERLVTIIQNPRQFKVPDWMLNRKKDVKDGKFSQVVSNTLDMKLREDLERLKKIRAHRGLRHYCAALPTEPRHPLHLLLLWVDRRAADDGEGSLLAAPSHSPRPLPSAAVGCHPPPSAAVGCRRPPSAAIRCRPGRRSLRHSTPWQQCTGCLERGGGKRRADHSVTCPRFATAPDGLPILVAGGLRVRGQRTKTTGRKGRTVGVSKHISMHSWPCLLSTIVPLRLGARLVPWAALQLSSGLPSVHLDASGNPSSRPVFTVPFLSIAGRRARLLHFLLRQCAGQACVVVLC